MCKLSNLKLHLSCHNTDIFSLEIDTSTKTFKMTPPNNDQSLSFEQMEISEFDKKKFITNNRKLILIIGIVLSIIIGIPLVAICINSKFMEAKWNEIFEEFKQSNIQHSNNLDLVDNRTRGKVESDLKI